MGGILASPPVSAQDLRLIDLVPTPLVYVSSQPTGSGSVDPVLELFDDPALRALVGFDRAASAASAGAAPGEGSAAGGTRERGRATPGSAFARLRQLLAMSTGEMELVLTDLVPRADGPDQPHLVGRVRLGEARRRALSATLGEAGPVRDDDAGRTRGRDAGRTRGRDAGRTGGRAAARTAGRDGEASRPEGAGPERAFARPHRSVGRHRTHVWSSAAPRRNASAIELALVGSDLLVSNSPQAMEQVLRGIPAQAPDANGLSADRGFRALSAKLAARAGSGASASLRVYLDWRRLWPRMRADLRWAERLFLQSLGLDPAEHVLFCVRAVGDAVRTTVLFGSDRGVGGLLAAAEPQPLRRLLHDHPPAGLAALTLSIDAERLGGGVQVGPGALFRAQLIGGCRSVGLDLRNQILPRLGRTGSCRLVLVEDRDRQSAHAAFSVRAKSARHAASLLDDVERTLGSLDVPVEPRGRGSRRVLEVTIGDGSTASLGVAGESLVLGLHPRLVERLRVLDAGRGRPLRTLARQTRAAVARLAGGRDRPVGIFHLDAAAMAGEPTGPEVSSGSTDSRDGDQQPAALLARRHIGAIFRDGDAARIEMVTPR